MPSRFRVRRAFRGFVQAIARPLARHGVPPDTVTYFSLLLSLLAGLALILMSSSILFGVLTFLTGLFDGVDGAIARLNNTSSKRGALMDSVVDKVAEMILLLSIGIAYPTTEMLEVPVTLWVLLCLFGWLMTSYARARAESLGVTDLDVGLGGRSERLLILVVFSLLNVLLWGLVVVTFVGLGTAAYRLYYYERQLPKEINGR
jgi:archaetidylinositol phosphate synthase